MNFTKKMNSKVLMSNIMLNYYLKKKKTESRIAFLWAMKACLKKCSKKKNQNCNLVLKNELKKY